MTDDALALRAGPADPHHLAWLRTLVFGTDRLAADASGHSVEHAATWRGRCLVGTVTSGWQPCTGEADPPAFSLWGLALADPEDERAAAALIRFALRRAHDRGQGRVAAHMRVVDLDLWSAFEPQMTGVCYDEAGPVVVAWLPTG